MFNFSLKRKKKYLRLLLTKSDWEILFMEVNSDPCEQRDARFRVVLHRPGSVQEGEKISEKSEDSELDESIVYIEPSTNLSSLASKFLQLLYEQSKVEGKEILKASNVKGAARFCTIFDRKLELCGCKCS